MVDHDFDGRAGPGVLTKLTENDIGVRGVVNDAEGVDQIVGLNGNEARELFGVARAEADLVLKPEDGSAGTGKLHGFFGEIDGSDLSAAAGEVDGVGADAAADFENFLATPALKLGKVGNVVFDEILAGFDFVKILPGADRRLGVA